MLGPKVSGSPARGAESEGSSLPRRSSDLDLTSALVNLFGSTEVVLYFWWQAWSRWLAVFLYIVFAQATLVYFGFSASGAGYQTYIDADGGSVTRRHTHLL